jgi:hypothetical protein
MRFAGRAQSERRDHLPGRVSDSPAFLYDSSRLRIQWRYATARPRSFNTGLRDDPNLAAPIFAALFPTVRTTRPFNLASGVLGNVGLIVFIGLCGQPGDLQTRRVEPHSA